MELDLNDSIWSKLGLNKLSLNLSVLVYILYFFLYILNTKHTVLSSAVCFTNQNKTCECINNKSKEVRCLLEELQNTSCEQKAKKSYELFCEVMSQFNCETKYSVKWNCTDCLNAYTKWLLAIFEPEDKDWLFRCAKITNLTNPTARVLFCKNVLARCPYFLPQDSYGDAPAFDCPLEKDDYKNWTCT